MNTNIKYSYSNYIKCVNYKADIYKYGLLGNSLIDSHKNSRYTKQLKIKKNEKIN